MTLKKKKTAMKKDKKVLEVIAKFDLEDFIDLQIRLSSKLESTKEAFQKSKKWGRISLAIVIGIFFLSIHNDSKMTNPLFIFGIGILFLNFLYSELAPYLWKKRIRKFITKEHSDSGDLKMIFTAQGINAIAKAMSFTYSWDDLGELNVEPGLVEFYFTKKGMVILREKYFSDMASMKEFIQQVNEVMPESKKSFFRENIQIVSPKSNG